METNVTQLQQVKTHLLSRGFITSWTAISKYHITRLSAYIHTLRGMGYEINSERIYPKNKNSNWFTNYTLKKK